MSASQPQIPLNLAAASPNLKTLLDALKTDIQLSINCHAVATVQSFTQNEVNGLFTLTAKINYSKTYFERQLDGSYRAVQKDYPLLVDCPAIVLGGGSTYLTFPIAEGDQCLVLFNDRDLSNWFIGAQAGPVASTRLHSFADAIALVGFQRVSSYDGDHALLSNGNAEVGVPTDKTSALVRIANATTTLNTLLQTLITDIKNISTTNAVVGTPCLISPASQSALTSAANAIAQLLE